MMKPLQLIACAVVAATLAGCSTGYQQASGLTPKGSPFSQALYKEYIAESKSEFDQGNLDSSDRWASVASASAQGQTPQPTQLSDWGPTSPAVSAELTPARQRLVTALGKGGGNVAPNEMAAAQRGYDCWSEQARGDEDFQPDDIAWCKRRYAENIAKVEAKLQPVAAAKPTDFLVFFDWDKYNLTPEAQKVIGDAVLAAKQKNPKTIKIVGHTDTSGSAAYNQKLSELRANAVKAQMVKLGVPAASITAVGVGQNDLLVPTKDGVREAQNRRAAISFPTTSASLDGREIVSIGLAD